MGTALLLRQVRHFRLRPAHRSPADLLVRQERGLEPRDEPLPRRREYCTHVRREEVLNRVPQVLQVVHDEGASHEREEEDDLEGVEEDVRRRAHEEPEEVGHVDGEVIGDGGEQRQGLPEEAPEGFDAEQTGAAVLRVGAVLPGDLEVLRGAFCIRYGYVRRAVIVRVLRGETSDEPTTPMTLCPSASKTSIASALSFSTGRRESCGLLRLGSMT